MAASPPAMLATASKCATNVEDLESESKSHESLEQSADEGNIRAQVEDVLFQRAARAVSDADFLLIAGGAGLSADSGLPTFAEINEHIGKVHESQLSYDQVGGSDMMCKDAPRFYGFWFVSQQKYSDAEPHEGYSILRSWRRLVEDRRSQPQVPRGKDDLDKFRRPENPVFALTSNVDCFFRRAEVASSHAIAEVHGSMDAWQCGGVPSGCPFPLFSRTRCGNELFEPPEPVDLNVQAMRLEGQPPRCPKCGEGFARPHVYLFGDGDRFVADEATTRGEAYRLWCEAVVESLRADSSLRLAIVEVGCGLRVPSIRKRCEELLLACPTGQAALIRVNPEFEQNGLVANPTIALRARALPALLRIQAEVERLSGGTPYPIRRITARASTLHKPLRIVCLSDTHSLHREFPKGSIPDGDILLHCGDFSKKGSETETQSFNTFLGSLPHAHKLVIGGNHDVGVFTDFQPRQAAAMLPNARYLNNELIEVHGLRIYGTPWDRRSCRGIPEAVDILMTHDPPEGILDGGHGCQYLRQEVDELQPRIHIFGHIHEASGVHGDDGRSPTMFINAALANNGMISRVLDKPIFVVDLLP